MILKQAKKFKEKYPFTVSWRIKQNAEIAERHLNPDEKVIYSFAAQKNDDWYNVFSTAVVVLTNKRILVAQKRVLFGYFFVAITPDLFNDLKVRMGMIWGKVIIDTINEKVYLSNISRKALPEIETAITRYMMEEKKKYKHKKMNS